MNNKQPIAVTSGVRQSQPVKNDIVLVPHPSDDPRDPLNWPLRKKVMTLAIVSYVAFVNYAQAFCSLSDGPVHGRAYGKTPTEMSYTLSAASAGVGAGPFLWLLVLPRLGPSFCIFWGMILALACTIWASQMTEHDQYVPYTLSRWMGGTFGAAAAVAGSGTILDIFFLHQRGWAFAIFGISALFGVQFTGTVSGYIVQFVRWPVEFYWTACAEASAILLVLFVLPNTVYQRDKDQASPSGKQRLERKTFLAERADMFLDSGPDSTVRRARPFLKDLLTPFAILASPVVLLCGLFVMSTYGWLVAVSALFAVYVQSPPNQGGYGFSPLGNANFSFTLWAGNFIGVIFLFFFQDSIPLWLCRRRGGTWRPEYRLIVLFVPVPLLCIGLGLIGAALQYHLHVSVLGIGVVLIYAAGDACSPVINNYLAESFVNNPIHTAATVSLFRASLGLVVPFFIKKWTAQVGVGWVFGMMACFAIFFSFVLGSLALYGKQIRSLTLGHFEKAEEERIIQRSDDEVEPGLKA